jgi:hypothetical protein
MPSPLKSPFVAKYESSDRSSRGVEIKLVGGTKVEASLVVGATNEHTDDPERDELFASHGAHCPTSVVPTTCEYVPMGHTSHGVEGSESPS